MKGIAKYLKSLSGSSYEPRWRQRNALFKMTASGRKMSIFKIRSSSTASAISGHWSTIGQSETGQHKRRMHTKRAKSQPLIVVTQCLCRSTYLPAAFEKLLRNSAVVLVLGKDSSGTDLSRKLHRRPQPSEIRKTSKRSDGTTR